MPIADMGTPSKTRPNSGPVRIAYTPTAAPSTNRPTTAFTSLPTRHPSAVAPTSSTAIDTSVWDRFAAARIDAGGMPRGSESSSASHRPPITAPTRAAPSTANRKAVPLMRRGVSASSIPRKDRDPARTLAAWLPSRARAR
ncbi:MAG: hypothetical protein FGM37_10395 [Phycisphaerales bacterium]|nr:hypothetical protein [Phycisphaerales bacterium]